MIASSTTCVAESRVVKRWLSNVIEWEEAVIEFAVDKEFIVEKVVGNNEPQIDPPAPL